jgi:hypothetical protein
MVNIVNKTGDINKVRSRQVMKQIQTLNKYLQINN